MICKYFCVFKASLVLGGPAERAAGPGKPGGRVNGPAGARASGLADLKNPPRRACETKLRAMEDLRKQHQGSRAGVLILEQCVSMVGLIWGWLGVVGGLVVVWRGLGVVWGWLGVVWDGLRVVWGGLGVVWCPVWAGGGQVWAGGGLGRAYTHTQAYPQTLQPRKLTATKTCSKQALPYPAEKCACIFRVRGRTAQSSQGVSCQTLLTGKKEAGGGKKEAGGGSKKQSRRRREGSRVMQEEAGKKQEEARGCRRQQEDA